MDWILSLEKTAPVVHVRERGAEVEEDGKIIQKTKGHSYYYKRKVLK